MVSKETIQSIFERASFKYPEQTAIIYESNSLSYRQLNEKANQLAHFMLSTTKIEPDNLIALCMDRNEFLIISLLAILKTGGAYVPIDPNFPDDRIEYILKDTSPKLILTNQSNFFKINSIRRNSCVIPVDELFIKNKVLTFPVSNPEVNISNKNLAYVIYTSGTTGYPKGVMIEHLSYIDVINSIKNLHFKNNEMINTYSITNYVFDIFGLEYGLPLLNGGTITLGNLEFSKLDCSKYSFIQMTPSFLNLKLDEILPSSACHLFVGGEPLNAQLLRNALKKFPSVTNLYGPTETTIWSTAKVYNQEETRITIGSAFENEQLYILKHNLCPVLQGEIGELHIGGVGLARGYLNRDDLTREKFIIPPFSKKMNLYKTGDMVRLLANGEIQYVGRTDFQVKVRGYRIELGEIESVLAEFPGIQQCIVIAKPYQSDTILIGYYVSKEKFDDQIILDYLQSKLPKYMVPQKLFRLTELPLTFNGKLDRKSLPEFSISLFADSYIAPSREPEKMIAKIWEKILGFNELNIGLNDDFFKLGGHSISAIKLIAEVNKNFATKLNIIDIYTNTTLCSFTKRVERNNSKYRSIIKYNHLQDIPDKPYIFMIHPGAGGCEVYSSLATKMNNLFNCYGVDSYNLYHSTKIDNLNELAQYYLNQISHHAPKANTKAWNFLGWSLGGQIALEMAAILEQHGYSNINIYLLDTVLNDSNLSKIRTELDIIPLKANHKKTALSKGYVEGYVRLLIENMDVEHKLICQNITGELTTSKVYLFKASIVESTENNPIQEHMATLKHNNIELYLKDKSNFHLIQVKHADHNNILKQEAFIYKTINKLVGQGT